MTTDNEHTCPEVNPEHLEQARFDSDLIRLLMEMRRAGCPNPLGDRILVDNWMDANPAFKDRCKVLGRRPGGWVKDPPEVIRIEQIWDGYTNGDPTIEIETVEVPGADPADEIWLRTMGNAKLGYIGVFESRNTTECICTDLFADQESCERQLLKQELVDCPVQDGKPDTFEGGIREVERLNQEGK